MGRDAALLPAARALRSSASWKFFGCWCVADDILLAVQYEGTKEEGLILFFTRHGFLLPRCLFFPPVAHSKS